MIDAELEPTVGAKKMTDEDRFKAFSAYAEISRKWVAIMDAKAGFTAALNLGLLAFLWTGAKLSTSEGWERWPAALATVLSLCSVCSAIFAAMPRESLKQIFGGQMRWNSRYHPISYYGYIAAAYGKEHFPALENRAMEMSASSMAREALEQHFVISHSVAKKSAHVKLAGIFLLAALACAGVALVIRILS